MSVPFQRKHQDLEFDGAETSAIANRKPSNFEGRGGVDDASVSLESRYS